jgi:hypothetical protein
VGYSFSTSLQPIVPEGIPMLDLGLGAPTIPLIQEIASERQYSEGNEDIENMYSQWRKEEPFNIDSEHVQNI